MEFPTMVYRSPGRHLGPAGMTYDYKGVRDQADLDVAISTGWRVEFIPPPTVEAEAPSDLPTRDDLIAEADLRGIKLDKRWGYERIATALKS